MAEEIGSIGVERLGEVIVLTILRPSKRNALDDDLIDRLVAELNEVSVDEARVLIITGGGDVSFCAGYDLDCINPETQGHLPLPDARFERVIEAVNACPIPVIGAINGDAFGGGLDLALACDFRIGREGAVFAMTPCKMGLVYSQTGISRFLRQLGPSVTKRLFLTAAPLGAEEALDLGIIDFVASRNGVMRQSHEIASQIAANPRLAVNGTKLVIQMLANRTLARDDSIEGKVDGLRRTAFESNDFSQALRAFKEKRKPRFSG